ncbi:type 1 glutamine amidotransferase domain-containing protein [Erysipelothrix urinaevulpis]|uniref:type 1 glutamine amidotransferase domain-containing protein n=1 Tax=Erysipelothrix urinaevulpis TaxID=2683717 RepID=UPI001357932B|nr:type 1 glutamine amidotransferase domain-containing protein [Erysipelothrix urinaevulpis]
MELANKKVLTIVSPDFDDLELWYPILRLREAGAQVDVASEKAKDSIKGKYGLSVQSDLSFDDVKIEEYDGLLIPGGWAPDYLRRLDSVLEFVKNMDENNRVIGQICHAGWVLSSADILKGRKVTSTPGIKHDLMHAGATWVDEAAVADGNLISGRRPPDLPVYLPLLIDALKK